MAKNKQDVTDVMDEEQKVEPKTKNDDLDNEPENAHDSQKETLQVFKKARQSKKVKTGIIITLAGITGFIVGRLTGKVKEPEPTEEIIDVEPETEETAE